jgi:uroporphyrinogen-III decarboxylase
MKTSDMTPKERWQAAVRMKPVDRLPFWPKLGGSYTRARTGADRNQSLDVFHARIGSNRQIGISGCFKTVRTHTSEETLQRNGVSRTVYRTPHGELDLIQQFDEASQSWHPVKAPVSTRQEIELMTEFVRDESVEPDAAGAAHAREQAAAIGQTAFTETSLGQSPLMHWVEWLAGIENAHYLLADFPAEVEALFSALQALLRRKTEISCASSVADAFYLIENTSTTLISPAQYRRYCTRHVSEIAGITRQAGRTLILHMCGHLKAILPDLAHIPAQAFEAFTSPTLGNTSLLDGRTQCPNTCLIGGTNAMLWTQPAKDIVLQIEQDLNALPHHRGLIVSSAGVMPPSCEPDTIKKVNDWLKTYPVKMASG